MRVTHGLSVLASAALLGCPVATTDDDAGVSDSFGSATDTTGVNTTDPSSGSTNPDPDSSTSSDDEESGSSSSGGTDACGVGRVCLGPPPLGWMGPIVIAKDEVPDALPSCVDPYPGNDITRLEGYADPGPAECECNCELNAASCQNYAYSGDGTACYTYSTAATEGCNVLTHAVTLGSIYAYSYPNGAAACDQTASENIPEIPWTAVVKGCTGGASDESCDATDGVCYNRPAEGFEEQICYLAQGDLPCPPDTDYVDKTIRFSAVEDTRACTNCQCGQISYCLQSFDYFTTADCSGTPAGTLGSATCAYDVTAVAVEFDFEGASCPVTSMSEPEGEATPLDPWTYCCATL